MQPSPPVDIQHDRDLNLPGNAASVTISIASPTWLLRGLSMLMAPAMVIIMGIDLRIRGQERILIHGIADEIAHVLTAIVMLSVLYALGWPVRWIAGILGAVAIDIDHFLVPEGYLHMIANTNRSALHTVGPALVVLVVGLVAWPLRTWFWSFGLAMLTHLLRDATTSELPLAWPVGDDLIHLRYSLYLTILVACTLVTTGVVALGARPPGHARAQRH